MPSPLIESGTPSAPPALYTEAILPSGRAVRIRRVTTAEYLGAKERALAAAAPGEEGRLTGRVSTALDRELLALAVVAYTASRSWEEELARQEAEHLAKFPPAEVARLREAGLPVPPFAADPEAALASVLPEEWLGVRPLDLLHGELSVEHLFSEVADYQCLVDLVGRSLLPAANLRGLVGKSRTAAR